MELLYLAAGIVAFAIGIVAGMSWQWRRDKPHIIADGGTGEIKPAYDDDDDLDDLDDWDDDQDEARMSQ